MIAWLTLGVLTATLIFLICYTYDTHRIANQTVQSSLQPVALVEGVIDFQKIKFTLDSSGHIAGDPINFKVLKNIAMDFRGEVIIDEKKYPLLFGNDASVLVVGTSSQHTFLKTWGWVPPDSYLSAIYDPSVSPETTTRPDGIYLEYSDIAGNFYHTIVDGDYKQTSSVGPLPK